MPDSTLSTLENIRVKIRRVTRCPSQAQLADATIDDYINSFILYDMPASVKLNSLKETLTFYTTPEEGEYETNTTDATDPLYNMKNKYTNFSYPAYVAGTQVSFSQNTEEFYSIYPRTSFKIDMGTGDGVETDFIGKFDSTPIMKYQVMVSSINTLDVLLLATDEGDGGFDGDVDALSTINYETGDYFIRFTSAPAAGKGAWLQAVQYVSSKPTNILYFQNKFTLRPVPNIAYKVEIMAYRRPTELDAAADIPELAQWWSYIALGAGIKILEDRMDTEAVEVLMPQFKYQELLINRRKIIQNAGKRTSTIYANSNEEKFRI